MKINKQLTSSTNSKQIISLNKSIKNISINNGTIFAQDKQKTVSNPSTTVCSNVISPSLSNCKQGLQSSGIQMNISNNTATSRNNDNSIILNNSKQINQNVMVQSTNNKLIKEAKESKQPRLLQATGSTAKKETSIEKLLKLNLGPGSTAVANSNNQNVPINNSHNKIQQIQSASQHNASNILDNTQDQGKCSTDGRIPSLKSSCKQRAKIVSCVKDVKINLIGPNKIKINSSAINMNNNNMNGGFSADKYSGLLDNQNSHNHNHNNNNPVVVLPNNTKLNNQANITSKDKGNYVYNRLSPKQFSNNNSVIHSKYDDFQENEINIASIKQPSSEITSAVNTNTNSMQIIQVQQPMNSTNQTTTQTSLSGLDSELSKTTSKRKANINITNNYNSNINVNTFHPPMNSIYDELSKKLVKPTSNNVKIGYFSEEIEPTNCVLNTEERSSRKKPNQNILEAENPEDLHFIQVEMLLQSKQISLKFELGDQDKFKATSKISPSKLPTLSVIPIDEIEL
jgi:hypothetical protein